MGVQSLLDLDIEEIPYFRELRERGEKRGEERGLIMGEERGFIIGEERGIIMGKIQLLQELKGLPVESENSLRGLSLDDLRSKLDLLR